MHSADWMHHRSLSPFFLLLIALFYGFFFKLQMQSDYDFVNAMPEDLGNLPKSKKGRGLTSNCVSETQKDERKCKKRKGNEEKLEERKRKKQVFFLLTRSLVCR